MKQKGFLLDINRCVGCRGCVVGCTTRDGINNGPKLRTVHTFNDRQYPSLPLFHLSLACNHCLDPTCLKHCPAGAYRKDPQTGAVEIVSEYCLGCRYCTWVCPYDAPKFNLATGVIEKCDFCNQRIREGRQPACVDACPTDALRLGEFAGDEVGFTPLGFTGSNISPAIEFVPPRKGNNPVSQTASSEEPSFRSLFSDLLVKPGTKIDLKSEWTLLVFTFVASMLAALTAASVFYSLRIDPFLFLGTGVSAMVMSTVHLSHKRRFYRALVNVSSSWLSREVLVFPLFIGLSGLYQLLNPGPKWLGWLVVATSVAALLAIDRVYQVAMTLATWNFHSAQALFNALFLFGVLAQEVWIAGPAALLKLLLYVGRKRKVSFRSGHHYSILMLLRVGLGFVIPALIFLFFKGFSGYFFLVIAFVVMGELIDRIEFYRELDIITPDKQMLIDLRRLLGSDR